MATYQVQSGDTLNQIAQRLNVAPTDVTGYKSGNPNLIFPGEILNINQTMPPVSSTNQNIPSPASTDTNLAQNLPSALSADQNLNPPTSTQTLTPNTGNSGIPDFTTQVTDILKKYGIEPPSSNQSPFTSFADTYKKIYENLGLTDVKTRIADTTKQLQDLEEKKFNDIADIQNNPFVAQSIRSDQIARVNQRYEAKGNALINRLKLDQTLFERGDEEAKFVAQQVLYEHKRAESFNENMAIRAIENAQKTAESEAKLNSINPAEFKPVQGGLYNIRTNQFVVPPKAIIPKPLTPLGSGNNFTKSQLNKGSATSGMSQEAFNRLDQMSQNYFINNKTDLNQHLKTIDTAFDEGGDLGTIAQTIDDSQLPDGVKKYLRKHAVERNKEINKTKEALPWWRRIF